MHFVVALLLALFSLPALADTPDWTGTWNTRWREGGARVELKQDGPKVTGSYLAYDGRIEGEATDRVLKARWFQGGRSGAVEFVLAPDGHSFMGRFDTGEWWTGGRIPGDERALGVVQTGPREAMRSFLQAGDAARYDAPDQMVRAVAVIDFGEGTAAMSPEAKLGKAQTLFNLVDQTTFRLHAVPDARAGGDGAELRLEQAGTGAVLPLRFVKRGERWFLSMPDEAALSEARKSLLALVLPAALAQAAPSFEACLGELAASAQARGVPQAVAAERLLGLSSDPDVLAATRNQAEFVKPIWSYIDAGIGDGRIAEGRRKLQDWAAVLDTIEQRFGVDRQTLVAFWGVESSYGAVLDDPGIVKPVIRSLATLACGDPGRAGYWRDELTAALQILANGDAPPERLTGSWAGAMGHTQFMPSVYQAHAVDLDGDGRRDIWGSVPDALASTANYLAAMGWRRGEAWGTEATLPDGFDHALADESTQRSLSDWATLGVKPAHSRPPADGAALATLILPAGARGPAFLLLPNFRIILRYNAALAYGLTVAHLSDRLRGVPAFARDWPRGDRVLTAEENRDLQTRLTERGLSVGGIDGKVGPKTRAAVRAYQASVGLVADGYADAALLERIRAAP